MKSPQKTVPFLIILASSAFVLDVMDVFGRYYSPLSIAKAACSILPFARLASFLLPAQLTAYASNQCQFEYSEPSTSIIFLMLKIILVYFAIGFSFFFWLPPIFQQTKKKIFLYIQEHGGIFNALKDAGWPVLGLSMACVYFYLQIDVQPDKYRTDIFVKLFEDLACTVLFFTLLALLRAMLFGIVYFFTGRPK